MNIEQYFKNKPMGFEKLSEDERIAISNFALIWTLFEAKLLDESANSEKILKRSKDWAGEGNIAETLDDHIKYFQNRYVSKDQFTDRYTHLNFRKKDPKELVESVLLGKDRTPASKLACCLIIIFRFRNNLFHGLKWAYELKDQQENFERSCHLLATCLENIQPN